MAHLTEDVIAHVMLQFPPSLDNAPVANDYYSTYWWPGVGAAPKNEGSTNWQNRGGYLRERTLPMRVGEHPKGASLSTALPLADSDWGVVFWRIECKRAQAMGIGGFMPDMQNLTPGSSDFNRCLQLCSAAYAENHKIMLCPDMAVLTGITAPQLVTAIQSCYNAAGPAGAALKRDANGRIVISPYLGAGDAASARDAAFWNSVTSGLASLGINISLLAVPNGMPSYTVQLFDGLANKAGFGIWGERNPGTDAAIDGLGAAMKGRPGNSNLIWCYPVSARDARHRDMQFDENWGFNQWLTTLQRMGTQAPDARDLILIMTWNDHSETSGICLTDRDPDGVWGKVAKPYFDNWRNGVATTAANIPVGSVDEVFVMSRSQILGATVELNSQMNAGTAYTSITIKTTTQNPAGDNTVTAAARAQLTIGAKLHTREGEVMTVAAQPPVNAGSVSIQSFTPTVTYGAGTVFTRAVWTYAPGVGGYQASVNRKNSGGSPSCTPNKDTYQVLTRLTSSGAVTVTDPSGTKATYTAPAGESSPQEYPAVAGAKPTGTLSRGGVQQLAFAARSDIASAPLIQDVGWYGSYASNPPTVPLPPQTNPAATKMRQARSTRKKLEERNAVVAGGQLVQESDTRRWKVGDNVTPYNLLRHEDALTARFIRRADLPQLSVVGAEIATGVTVSTAMTDIPTTGYVKWTPGLVALSGSDRRWKALELGAGDYQIGSAGDARYSRPNSKYNHTYGSQDTSSFEFEMSGQYFQWLFKYTATSNTYRLSIDGRPYTFLPQSVAGTTIGNDHLMSFNFGSSRPRRIRIDMYNTPNGGIYLPPTDAMNTPLLPPHRLMAFGDSITDGSGLNIGSGTGTWLQRFAREAGFRDVWNQALGGTGYLDPGAFTTLINRVAADVIAYSPTHLINWAGTNDLDNGTAAQIGAAAAAVVAAQRDALPNCQIYLVGMHRPYDQFDSDILAADTALKAAALAQRVPFWSPATGDVYSATGTLLASQGPWITGTGKQGALNGTGNSDLFIGSDGIHPTDAGHAHYARCMLNAWAVLLP